MHPAMLIPSLLARKVDSNSCHNSAPPITNQWSQRSWCWKKAQWSLEKSVDGQNQQNRESQALKTPQTKIVTQPERTSGFTSKGAVKPLLQWRLMAFLTTLFFQGPYECHACMQINLPWFFPLQHSVRLTFGEHIGSSIFPGTLSPWRVDNLKATSYDTLLRGTLSKYSGGVL